MQYGAPHTQPSPFDWTHRPSGPSGEQAFCRRHGPRGCVNAADINAAERTGFIWTARDGMINLNQRLRKAPAGLAVTYGLAISDTGVIFASTNAGFVLLKPDCGAGLP